MVGLLVVLHGRVQDRADEGASLGGKMTRLWRPDPCSPDSAGEGSPKPATQGDGGPTLINPCASDHVFLPMCVRRLSRHEPTRTAEG